jgi:hypothetical protein
MSSLIERVSPQPRTCAPRNRERDEPQSAPCLDSQARGFDSMGGCCSGPAPPPMPDAAGVTRTSP